ncbi:MAG: carotenoid biosynthesis protein [Mycobacterium sp.]
MALALPVRSMRTIQPVWVLVAAAIAVQIIYPLIPDGSRNGITVASVVVFFLAAVADVIRLHGTSGAVVLIAVAGGGGLLAESIGVTTGWPFGAYTYAGTLGPQLLGVPVVIPLAWVMMAWPALVVARTLATRGAAVIAVGAVALTSWDVFLDPQMVAAGHWTWSNPSPSLPLVPGIPLTNYLGWLLVTTLIMAALHVALRRHDRPSAPAATLYLWVYFSSVMGHFVFFGLPGSAVAGGLVMGTVAIPFAITLLRRRTDTTRQERT